MSMAAMTADASPSGCLRQPDRQASNQRSKNMSRSAQEIVDAIVTAAVLRGADGRGQGALDGYMLTMARTNSRRFGILLGWALRLKMKARRGTDDEKPDFLTDAEARAELRG